MTTPITTSTIDSQMHNNVMAAGSRDRPPMLTTGRYAQWQSRFMRYVDTKPNGEALRKCILQGPCKISIVTIPGQPVIDESPAVEEQTVLETFSNITPENKAQYDVEKEAIHLIFTRIRDEIYSIFTRQLMICGQLLKGYNRVNLLTSKMSRLVCFGSLADLLQEMKSQLCHTTPGKEIAKPITPPSESAFKEFSDPEQAQRDKDMQKNLAFIAK
ncbi:hypothetical protein Tco_1439793 [Tanacetum coccineum]